MLKTRKRWVSLLVSVVMVAGLLIPFVGTANALATYSITSVNNISAGNGIPQVIGSGETTFDVPTWDSIGSTNGSVYASLPSSPLGFAYCDPALEIVSATAPTTELSRSFWVDTVGAAGSVSVPITLSNGVTIPYTPEGSQIVNGCGMVTLTGADYVAEPGFDATTVLGAPQVTDPTTHVLVDLPIPAGWYPSELNISVSPPPVTPKAPATSWTFASNCSILGSSSATSVTVMIASTIWVPSGVTGGVTQTLAAPSGSVWSSGSGTIAMVGNATLTVAVESTPAISSAGGSVGLIDVTENAAGALYSGGSPGLKLTLPPGFTWEAPTNGAPMVEYMWGAYSGNANAGNIFTAKSSNAGRELDIGNAPSIAGLTGSAEPSTTAQFVKINAGVSVDEATAQIGNITVTVAGQTSSNVSTLVVGSYGSFGLTCDASGTTPTIVAGEQGDTIGELEVKEGIPGSIIYGRTITLTLPTDVAWSEYPTLDTTLSTNTGSGVGAFNDWAGEGTNGNQIQCTVGGGTLATGSNAGPTSGQTEPGDFFFKNMEVTPAIDFSGPLTVTVSGSEGLTGTVTLATIGAPVTVAAASTPTVGIGTSGQTLGDMTITEVAAGDIGSVGYYSGLVINSTDTADNYLAETTNQPVGTTYLYIVAPVGVTFDTTPTVTVTSGNIQLGTATTGTDVAVEATTTAGNQGVIEIPIDSSSTTASTIKIAAPVVSIDRTVPSGPVTVKVEGTALDQTSLGSALSGYAALFPNDTTAASVSVATVGTGTTGAGGTAVFTIGQTSYTLNGQSETMDVAPYIKDSRTFLPIRYVAEALGVPDSNISFNNGQVVINKNGTMVVLNIGSMTMLVGGASVTMDAAPEITNGRTCLPIAWVAMALNANCKWDATAKTVTVVSN